MNKKFITLKEDTMERVLVLEKIIDQKVTQQEGADRLGLTDRQVRRLLVRYKASGMEGLKRKIFGGNRAFSKEM